MRNDRFLYEKKTFTYHHNSDESVEANVDRCKDTTLRISFRP